MREIPVIKRIDDNMSIIYFFIIVGIVEESSTIRRKMEIILFSLYRDN